MSIGSLFILGFEGTSLSADTKDQLLKIKPAGIILYDSNIESREQVRALIAELRSLLGDDLIVTVDQEGGKVERLRKISTSLPSLMALGRVAEQKPEALVEHSQVLAEELADLGFNMVLAPCADLHSNPANPIIGSRSLGSDAELVSQQLKTIIKTYHDYGVLSCAKHFPGHGATSKDSHVDLPSVDFSPDFQKHIRAFEAAIEADVPAMMMAHVLYPGLDDLPASLSKKIIHDELKNRLGFDGLVITDELGMAGATKFGTPGEISRLAIEAGNDLLLWFTNLDESKAAYDYLSQIKDQSFIERVNESIDRVESFKARLDKNFHSPVKELEPNRSSGKQLNKNDLDSNQKKMLELTKAAIDWHLPCDKIQNNFAEINQETTAIIAFVHPKLELEVLQEIFDLKVFALDLVSDSMRTEATKALLSQIKNFKNIIILTWQTINHPWQQRLVDDLREEASYNLAQVSTDQPDKGADIDLFGVNQIHLKALKLQLFY